MAGGIKFIFERTNRSFQQCANKEKQLKRNLKKINSWCAQQQQRTVENSFTFFYYSCQFIVIVDDAYVLDNKSQVPKASILTSVHHRYERKVERDQILNRLCSSKAKFFSLDYFFFIIFLLKTMTKSLFFWLYSMPFYSQSALDVKTYGNHKKAKAIKN